MLTLIGIDINGLNADDQIRIQAIGLRAWMDEVAPTHGLIRSRYSLEYQQAQMKRRMKKTSKRKRRSRTLATANFTPPAC
jgi:hypothetical protein